MPPLKTSPFVRVVLRLNDQGIDWETARWAAGQATCREPEAQYPTLLALAMEILAAREAL